MNERVRDSVFRYHAASRDGRMERGRLGAATRDAAAAALFDRGLQPLSLVLERQHSFQNRSLSDTDLALTFSLLADLLDAGVPILRALQTLESLVSARVASVIPSLVTTVSEGGSFSQALESSGVDIPPTTIGIIRSGERGGALAASVRQAGALCADAAATKSAIRSALAYPLLLASVGSVSLGLLVGVVLPRFAAILGDLGQALPTSTRMVLQVGALVRSYAVVVAAVAVVVVASVAVWTRSTDGRLAWHALLLRMPLGGETRLAAGSSRLSTALGALLSNGISMAAALRSAASASGDEEVIRRVRAAADEVEQGSRLSDALARHRATTPLTIRLARAGEESGRLPAMLANAGQMERARVLRRVATAVRLIEPTIILVFGGVVGIVAASLLQALYSIRPVAQ